MLLKMLVTVSLFLPPAAPAAQLKVKWEAGKLSLDAEGVPLSRVLQAVAAKTGSEITGAEELNQRVTEHFAKLELLETLKELLSGLDYGIALGPPVTRVLIVKSTRGSLAKRGATAQAGPSAKTDTDVVTRPDADSQEAKLAAIGTAANDRNGAVLTGYLRDGNAAVQAAAFQEMAAQNKDGAIESLLSEVKDPTQAGRLQALQLLVQSAGADQTVTMGALRDALKDPDPAFNSYAVQMLAGYSDPAAADALSNFFQAADAATKLTIIEQLAGAPAALPLLREAASDPDPAVSARAAALLKGFPVGSGGGTP
jgi:hypothetical protein